MEIEKIDRIIEMAWEDRTPFEAIKNQFGFDESEVIKLMRNNLKKSSFKLWRKRVNGRTTKHLKLSGVEMIIFGNRHIDYTYLIPFIPFWSAQSYNGDIDNLQLFGEILETSVRLIFHLHNLAVLLQLLIQILEVVGLEQAMSILIHISLIIVMVILL